MNKTLVLEMSAERPTNTDAWGAPTRWTVILDAAAASDSRPRVEAAWRELVERYRSPVEGALRRRLPAGVQAQEVTEDFFAYLFEKGVLSKVDPSQGRFRAYVQAVLRRYTLHYLRSISTGVLMAPDPASSPDFDEGTLEDAEEAEWAEHVLSRALDRLRGHSPKDAELLTLAYGIEGEIYLGTRALGERFGLSTNALYVGLHRARGKLRAALMEELRDAVATPSDLEQEWSMTVRRLMEARPGLADALRNETS